MFGHIFKTILLSGALLSGAIPLLKDTTGEQEPHSDPFRSCITSECHTPVVRHKYLHGPLVIGQCTVCHAPIPGPDHKFRILQNDAALCGECHKPVDTEKFLHDPVAEGNCLECHDPHGSSEPSLIRISPLAKLCNDCHDPLAANRHVHDPVAEGECLECHSVHGSKEPKLLIASGRSLCFKCHEDLDPAAAGTRDIHLAEEDCASCHWPHNSRFANLLTKPLLELCFGCHEDLKERIQSDAFTHEAVTEGQACSECHRAHISTLHALLREPPVDLCYSCHEELKTRVDAAKYKHQPVEDNACGSCHLPHSSRYANLLLAESPAGSYAPYDPAKYALCFSCHEEALADERYTETVTDFRNGSLNLHYLHVNKEDSGRTCSACHDGHLSNQPKLIREQVSYGNWRFAIRFIRTETGGSCSTGCHDKFAYDRINPLQLKTE